MVMAGPTAPSPDINTESYSMSVSAWRKLSKLNTAWLISRKLDRMMFVT